MIIKHNIEVKVYEARILSHEEVLEICERLELPTEHGDVFAPGCVEKSIREQREIAIRYKGVTVGRLMVGPEGRLTGTLDGPFLPVNFFSMGFIALKHEFKEE